MRKAFLVLLASSMALLLVFLGVNVYSENADDLAGDTQRTLKPQAETTMDFTGLVAKNKEIAAWLTVDGTNIDYPVVQAPNNRYYLTRTADRKTSKQGALFIEYRNDPHFTDFSTIIYGHNLKSGKMFGRLEKFKDKKYFEQHKTGTLFLPGTTLKLEFLASAVTTPTSDYYQFAFRSLAERQAHLAMIKKTATHWRGLELGPADRLLVLSTCSYEFKDARTVVVAKFEGH
jgi:sortase B